MNWFGFLIYGCDLVWNYLVMGGGYLDLGMVSNFGFMVTSL
jgi:hypothetical protein